MPTDKTKIAELKAKAAKAKTDARRRRIIVSFYEFIRSEAELKVFNKDLTIIYVNSRSANETATHASKSTDSTFAVFELIEILKNAKKVKEEAVKASTKNQQRFQKMIILEDNIKGIGKVKLTVGVLKSDSRHIQYCLTAVK